MIGTKETSPSAGERVPAPAATGLSKIAVVLALLDVEQGATLEELVNAAGWQPHTARAVLSGLKKKAHTIEREKANGVSRYRITKGAAQ